MTCCIILYPQNFAVSQFFSLHLASSKAGTGEEEALEPSIDAHTKITADVAGPPNPPFSPSPNDSLQQYTSIASSVRKSPEIGRQKQQQRPLNMKKEDLESPTRIKSEDSTIKREDVGPQKLDNIGITDHQRSFLNAIAGPRKAGRPLHKATRLQGCSAEELITREEAEEYPAIPQNYVVMIHSCSQAVGYVVDIHDNKNHSLLRKRKKNKEADPQNPATYEAVADSYLKLFCRQCDTFDCPFHLSVPSEVTMEAAVALRYDSERSTQGSSGKSKDPYASLPSVELDISMHDAGRPQEEDAASPTMRVILARMMMICGNDSERLNVLTGGRYAKCLIQLDTGATETERLRSMVTGKHISYWEKQKKKRLVPKEMRGRVKAKGSRSFFSPCSHGGECTEDNGCSCIARDLICTQQCVWGKFGRNMFPGCSCREGYCRGPTCECFLASRECDPDICGCKCCNNMDMTMSKKTQLFIAQSSVVSACFGLFTKLALRKGDFVGEYTGKYKDSSEESESTAYYFDTTKEFCVDSEQQGSMMRFINHSDGANVGFRTHAVKGSARTGVYCLADIPAQGELFLDYGESFDYRKYGVRTTKYAK